MSQVLTAPGFKIRDLTQVQRPDRDRKIDNIVLFAEALSAIDPGLMWTPVEVPTVADMETRVGSVRELIRDCYATIRRIAPDAVIYVVPTSNTFPANIELLITSFQNLPLSILLWPEKDQIDNGYDSTQNSFEDAWKPVHTQRRRWLALLVACAENGKHLVFSTTGPEIKGLASASGYTRFMRRVYESVPPNTIDPATVARGVNSGRLSYFYGWVMGRAVWLPLSVFGAAWVIQHAHNETGVHGPGGRSSLLGAEVLEDYRLTYQQATDARAIGGLNYAWRTGKGWHLWGDATTSPDPGWGELTSRLSLSMLAEALIRAFNNLLFTPILSTDAERNQFQAKLISVCDRAVSGQIISGYQLLETRIDNDTGAVGFALNVRPFGSIHSVQIDLRGSRHGSN